MFTTPLHYVPRFPRRTKISGGCGWGTSLVLQRMQRFSLNSVLAETPSIFRKTQARQYLTSRPCWLEKYAARSWTSRGERLATWPCMIGFLRLPFL